MSIIETLRCEPAVHKTDLADRQATNGSSSILSETVKEQRERGLIRYHPDRNQYESTLLGDLVVDIYVEITDALNQEAIKQIASSANVIPILCGLDDHSGTVATLSTNDRIDANRSTINRRLSDLEAIGWVVRTPPYELSVKGRSVLEKYDEFESAINCVLERREFLRSFDMKGLPLAALRGTQVHTASGANPHAPSTQYIDAIGPHLDHICGVSPIVTESYVEAFAPLVTAGCEIELVLDKNVRENYRSNFPMAYLIGLVADNATGYIASENITVGIAILDGTTVWLGAYDETGRHRAVLEGSNDVLVEWAMDVYREARAQAALDERRITAALKGLITYWLSTNLAIEHFTKGHSGMVQKP